MAEEEAGVAPRKQAAKKAPRKAAKKVAAKSPRRRPPRKDAPEAPEAQAAIEEIRNPPAPVDPYVRARAAHEKLLAGAEWETIVAETEYDTVAEATMDVQAYLSFVHVMTGDEERQMAKRLELNRLDAMWREWYELGTIMKSKDAALVLLAISKRRAELHELDRLSQRSGSTQTIVVTSGADMALELQRIAEEQQAAQERQRQELADAQAAANRDVVDAEVVS